MLLASTGNHSSAILVDLSQEPGTGREVFHTSCVHLSSFRFGLAGLTWNGEDGWKIARGTIQTCQIPSCACSLKDGKMSKYFC